MYSVAYTRKPSEDVSSYMSIDVKKGSLRNILDFLKDNESSLETFVTLDIHYRKEEENVFTK